MEEHSEHESTIEGIWRTFLTTGLYTKEFRYRHLFGLLPANPDSATITEKIRAYMNQNTSSIVLLKRGETPERGEAVDQKL